MLSLKSPMPLPHASAPSYQAAKWVVSSQSGAPMSSFLMVNNHFSFVVCCLSLLFVCCLLFCLFQQGKLVLCNPSSNAVTQPPRSMSLCCNALVPETLGLSLVLLPTDLGTAARGRSGSLSTRHKFGAQDSHQEAALDRT